ncbi:MAG: polyphosphate polymerase domain-containing protein [Johnsonella sp.]|nr:polyphosphate polymerase domain-containing protein [Johnsonella sp.]
MAEFLDVLRTEKKYRISPITAGRIKQRLSSVLAPDENCRGGRAYIVKSLYFDSIDSRDYREKESGVEFRRKIRLRTYGEGDIVKLEWKRKQGAKQRKQSLLLRPEDARELMECRYSCLLKYEDELARRLYTIMSEEVYIPRCMIVYRRTAFVHPTNDIRITIDSGISADEGRRDIFSESRFLYPVQEFGDAVLEVKYNHFLLDYIRKAISFESLTESANSKYIAGRYFGFRGVKV